MTDEELLRTISQAKAEGWTELDLHLEHLTTLPQEIGQLAQLQELDISSNQLTALPPEIGQLIQLQKLDISFNQLTVLPPEIAQLVQLTSLILRDNKLGEFPSEIWQLTQLQSLDLAGVGLKVLPPEIGQLTELYYLNLSRNDLRLLPPQIGQLDQLLFLHIMNSGLLALPSEISGLAKLESLFLSSNLLTELPTEVTQLSRLERLDLSSNNLTVLLPGIDRLAELRFLDLRGNSLPIPPEILEKALEPWTIINYYLDHIYQQRHPLNEVKMVIVGQGSVGKTSLVNRLAHDTYNPDENKTEGIAITRWEIENHESRIMNQESPPHDSLIHDSPIHINIWDFGGQEIMHATHQFFLTKRTLYVLVLDARLNEAENRLDYWLQIIQSFGGNSPVIIVGNKIDQQALDLDRRGVMARHPNVQAIVETSCATGDGLDALQDAIAAQIAVLPHVRDELLATWFDAKAEIEALDADYISFDQYVELCQQAGVNDARSQRTLLGFLHDLGIVLCFQDDPRLAETHILNPEWVTRGVYRILNDRALLARGGVLERETLSGILDPDRYPWHRHLFILDMMRKFELCFDFEGQVDQTFLIPDLLPKTEPETGDWTDSLAFRYDYAVLPGSVISRFIVRMHPYIEQNVVWRTGVVLAYRDNRALVKVDVPHDRITVRVGGAVRGRRTFLGIIRSHFDYIHRTITGLQVTERVPLPGRPDIAVDYEHLLTLEELGDTHFVPSGLRERVSVRELLDGVRYFRLVDRGIPGYLTPRLRTALRQSDVFDSDRRLRTLFADARLHPWRDALPDAHDRDERVDALLDYLYDQTNARGDSALILFLRVLCERINPDDALHRRLSDLADELDFTLRRSNRD